MGPKVKTDMSNLQRLFGTQIRLKVFVVSISISHGIQDLHILIRPNMIRLLASTLTNCRAARATLRTNPRAIMVSLRGSCEAVRILIWKHATKTDIISVNAINSATEVDWQVIDFSIASALTSYRSCCHLVPAGIVTYSVVFVA
jgi:hypothetical protein